MQIRQEEFASKYVFKGVCIGGYGEKSSDGLRDPSVNENEVLDRSREGFQLNN